MTLHLASWSIPALLTAAIWCTAFFKPLPARRGDYDFTAVFVGFVRLLLAIIATLTVWLGYLLFVLVIEWG